MVLCRQWQTHQSHLQKSSSLLLQTLSSLPFNLEQPVVFHSGRASHKAYFKTHTRLTLKKGNYCIHHTHLMPQNTMVNYKKQVLVQKGVGDTFNPGTTIACGSVIILYQQHQRLIIELHDSASLSTNTVSLPKCHAQTSHLFAGQCQRWGQSKKVTETSRS